MSHDLTYFGMSDMLDDLPEPVRINAKFGGMQALWRFPNGRGASVVNHSGSYGTELAVLRYTSEDVGDYELDYSTPVTDDVIGHIGDAEELLGYLRQIRDLPAPGSEDTGDASGSGSGGDFFTALSSLSRMTD